jgi:iron(III) transport system substrate-binding protein
MIPRSRAVARLSRTARRPARRTARPPAWRAACVAAVAAAVAGGLLSGCGSGGSGTTLTLYNGQHEQTANALVSAFEKQTGITVNVTSNDEDVLADEVATQGASSPADLIFTENTPALEYLQGKHLLAKVDPATLAHTPSRYNSAQGDWVGVSARVSVLIYNPRLISKSQLPTSVLQLASPRYQGKLAFAAGETDFQPIVTSVLHSYGRAATISWLRGIKANADAGGHVYPDNETISSQVNQGAAAFGVINQYYWYRMRDEVGASGMHSQIAYFAPHDPGYVIDVSPAAILKSSKHQAAAQKFLAFLVSKAGQEIIANPKASQSFEYPIASGVTTMTPETPFGQLKPYPISLSELGDGSTAISLLRQAGLL